MARNFRDKIALSGTCVLSIGLALLVITFASAFGFMSEALPILASQDLVQTFGETLAPLIATSIRVMYLGVMGWIGSLVTLRGVTIIANSPKTETNELQKQPELKPEKPQTQSKLTGEKTKPKQVLQPETKPATRLSKPELIVIQPEEIEQQTQKPQA